LRSYIIILTSITYVHKVKELLARNNIKSHIVKLQAMYERRGCGYGLEVTENYMTYAVSFIEKHRIKIVEIQQADDYDNY